MEAWSDPIVDKFRVKFFFDTQLLSFLIDSSYSDLNSFVNILKLNSFVKLLSSRFVIIELVGVRKREQFLREAFKSGFNNGQFNINLSSLIKHKEIFHIRDINFYTLQNIIENEVKNELEALVNNYGIEYDSNIIHPELFSPVIDIMLSSKISSQDSIVLISSVYPDVNIKEDHVILLTGDSDFEKFFNESALIDTVFTKHNLRKPYVYNIGVLPINPTDPNSSKINLFQTDPNLQQKLLRLIKQIIVDKNRTVFLGKTIPCGNHFPHDIICFKLLRNVPLNSDIYVTILGADLTFIYNTRVKIHDFWDQTPIANYPYTNANDRDISFKLTDIDENGNIRTISQNIMDRLKERGNLVFITPDTG